MDEQSAPGFVPPRERCFERLCLARFETVTCVYSERNLIVTPRNDRQRHPAVLRKECETHINGLTNTDFGQYRFELEALFYIVKEKRSEPTAQTAWDFDRVYEIVPNSVHKVQDVSGDIGEFEQHDRCEAAEIYVTPRETGLENEKESPRECGLTKGRGKLDSDKPPVLTLVCRGGERVQILACKDLEDADKEIGECGDGSVIRCTDGYIIYRGIEGKDGGDGFLAVTHSDTYVIDDAHTNSCENRQSYLRQWLAKFRGGSKYILQRYLNSLN